MVYWNNKKIYWSSWGRKSYIKWRDYWKVS